MSRIDFNVQKGVDYSKLTVDRMFGSQAIVGHVLCSIAKWEILRAIIRWRALAMVRKRDKEYSYLDYYQDF